MKPSNECDIARDLMPLSVDGVCSEGSQHFLDAHVSSCAACRALYSGMKTAETPTLEIDPAQKAAALQRSLQRVKRRQRLWMILAAVACSSLLLGWNLLMTWSPWSRPTDIPISQYTTQLYARGSTVFLDLTGRFDADATLNHRVDVQRVPLPDEAGREGVIVTLSLEYYPDDKQPLAHIFPDEEVSKTIHLGYECHSDILHGSDLCLKDGNIYQIAGSRQSFTDGRLLLDPGLPVYEICITDNTNTRTIYRMGDAVCIDSPWYNSILREDYELQHNK